MHTLSINEYRAIKNAVIKIDGITVLAGINGCGKSTLSRWLYYLINATHLFEQYQRHYFIQSLDWEVNKVHRVFRATPKNNTYVNISNQLRHFWSDDELDWDGLRVFFSSFIDRADEDLREYVRDQPFDRRLASYLSSKDVSETETNNLEIIDAYLQECNDVYENGFRNYLQKIESYAINDLEKVITSEYSEGERLPASILLTEGNTPLLRPETFSPPLMLSRAIYIDSPMAVSAHNYMVGNDIWSVFLNYLYKENPHRKELPTTKYDVLIQSIIGGSIKLVDDKFELEKELHYVSNEQGIDINIRDAATGVKTFAYMSQLLRNGWLDNETLLLIDEPEAHLHPQWIVEFARLLVMIHKELGVKVLIASHNPDMVAAIQSIAQREEVIDKTVFYLAQKEKDEARYVFVDKGKDISDIFTSFNIAISRIEKYGGPIM